MVRFASQTVPAILQGRNYSEVNIESEGNLYSQVRDGPELSGTWNSEKVTLRYQERDSTELCNRHHEVFSRA